MSYIFGMERKKKVVKINGTAPQIRLPTDYVDRLHAEGFKMVSVSIDDTEEKIIIRPYIEGDEK